MRRNPTPTCKGCGNDLPVAQKTVGDDRYCPVCYRTKFLRVDCVGCGEPTRALPEESEPRCLYCAPPKRSAQCACGNTCGANSSLGQDGQPKCRKCTNKNKPLEPCPRCSRMDWRFCETKSGHGRVCNTCYNSLDGARCSNCRQWRMTCETAADGSLVCGACRSEPFITCQVCGEKKRERASRTRCIDCKFKARFTRHALKEAEGIKAEWLKPIMIEFVNWYVAQRSPHYAHTHRERIYWGFRFLEDNFQGLEYVNGPAIYRKLPKFKAARFTPIITFLIARGYVAPITDRDRREARNQALIDRILTSVESEWYYGVLQDFSDYEVRGRVISIRLRNLPKTFTAIKSGLMSARSFMSHCDARGRKAMKDITADDVDAFYQASPGFASSLRIFLRWIKETDQTKHRLMGRRSGLPSICVLGEVQSQNMMVRIVNETDDPGAAMLGLLVGVFAQRAHMIAALPANAFAIQADGNYLVTLARVPIDVPPHFTATVDRYLAYRQERMIRESFTSDHLFPAWRGALATSAFLLAERFRKHFAIGINVVSRSCIVRLMLVGRASAPELSDALGYSRMALGILQERLAIQALEYVGTAKNDQAGVEATNE